MASDSRRKRRGSLEKLESLGRTRRLSKAYLEETAMTRAMTSSPLDELGASQNEEVDAFHHPSILPKKKAQADSAKTPMAPPPPSSEAVAAAVRAPATTAAAYPPERAGGAGGDFTASKSTNAAREIAMAKDRSSANGNFDKMLAHVMTSRVKLVQQNHAIALPELVRRQRCETGAHLRSLCACPFANTDQSA
jgi:hypothetical protein